MDTNILCIYLKNKTNGDEILLVNRQIKKSVCTPSSYVYEDGLRGITIPLICVHEKNNL